MEHAATCWSYLDHLVDLDPAIQMQVGSELKPGQPFHVRIPVKAGQVIGKVCGGFTFDFALIDTSVREYPADASLLGIFVFTYNAIPDIPSRSKCSTPRHLGAR